MEERGDDGLSARSRLVLAAIVLAGLGAAIAWRRDDLASWARRLGEPSRPPYELAPPAAPRPAARRPAASAPRTHLPPATLSGPAGTIALPADGLTLVNVWLERCADCMPHFEAWARLAEGGELPDLPVVNVAFGQADLLWATSFSVDEDLVFDRGSAIVRPLGITKFTTMLVAADGRILFRGHPAAPGFAAALHAAVAAPGAEERSPDGG